MNGVLFKTYDPFEWGVDRLCEHAVKFIDDQKYTVNDTFSREYSRAMTRDLCRYGYLWE